MVGFGWDSSQTGGFGTLRCAVVLTTALMMPMIAVAWPVAASGIAAAAFVFGAVLGKVLRVDPVERVLGVLSLPTKRPVKVTRNRSGVPPVACARESRAGAADNGSAQRTASRLPAQRNSA